MALIIHPALIRLKEIKHGAPNTDDEDAPEELRSTNSPPKESKWDSDEFHFLRWDWILDEMIWAFGQLNIDWESQFWTGEFDYQFEKMPDSTNSRMIQGPNHTAVHDYNGHRAHGDRIQNGIRLFAKYYMALWD